MSLKLLRKGDLYRSSISVRYHHLHLLFYCKVLAEQDFQIFNPIYTSTQFNCQDEILKFDDKKE
jgi:hypothetical protein